MSTGAQGTTTAEVAVVVPFYEQQAELDLVLAALELQTLGPERLEVVVADDGSAVPPVAGHRPYPVRVVHQEDRGFRASAARALGAAATSAPVLCFLDADTVPEPDYLARLTAVVHDGPCGTLAVGRRRHADLDGWTPAQVRSWLTGQGPAPRELDEPGWLREAYAASDDLREADDRSYRFVISAVMALTRRTYEAAGGFDPSFVGYGGEDWDLAHRCWLAGADLRHVAGAVAWHDGPDVVGRPARDARRVKDEETLRLAQVLTDPLARGHGLWWRYPQTAVRLTTGDATGEAQREPREARDVEPGVLAVSADALLRAGDAAVWLVDLDAVPPALAHDPRVHAGEPPVDVRQRARQVVTAVCGLALDRTLAEIVADGPATYHLGASGDPDEERLGPPVLRVERTRDRSRGQVAGASRPAGPAGIRRASAGATLEAVWGGWA